MIEPMLQVTLLFTQQRQEAILLALQQDGLIHFDLAAPTAAALEPPVQYRKKIEALLKLYPPGHFSQIRREVSLELDLTVVDELTRVHRSIQETQKEITLICSEIPIAAPYGDFNEALLEELRKQGLYLLHYRVDQGELRSLKGLDWFSIFTKEGKEYLVVVSKDPNLELPFKKLSLPEKSVTALKGELKALREQKESLLRQEEILLEDPTPIQHLHWEVSNLIEFERAKKTTQQEEQVNWLVGYCPKDRLFILEAMAQSHGFALLARDADQSAATPVRIKQNRWTRLFAPVMAFIGVVPGYDERDAGPAFLIFFTLFFALLVGDGGYGLVMLALTCALKLKKKDWPPEVFHLFFLLSGASLVWGALTGLWFGYEPLGSQGFLRALVIPELYAYAKESDALMIRLVFILGLTQLLLAHFWEFSRKPRLAQRLTEVGWGLFLIGAFFLAKYFLLQDPMPPLAKSLFVVGLGLVLLFGEQRPQRSWLKGLAWGVAQFPMNLLGAIGFFSDLVSYIRLFALGLATKQMAQAANDLALSGGHEGFFGVLGAVVILLLGHSINLTLAGVAVMVHGIRLNFLEFAKHLNMQWTGKPFVPFQRAPRSF